MISLVKMSLRLLLRNKGFWFFLLVTPVLSSFILNIKVDQKAYRASMEDGMVLELDDCTERAVYSGNTTAFIIKVYDASHSELSEYVLQQLAKNGMFSVCRADAGGLTGEEVDKTARKDAFDDHVGVLVYLKSDFEEAVWKGDWEKGIQLYEVSDDERKELFLTELTGLLARIKRVQEFTGKDTTGVLDTLEDIQTRLPQKEVVNFTGKDAQVLTQQQINQHSTMGYAFAIITLGFVFCGVFVAHSVIEEQNSKVYTRIMLTKVSSRKYFISKFTMSFFISALQTLVLGICMLLMPNLDVGIPMGSFLLVIFLLGLIFSTLSLLIGVLMGDVMSANYTVFAVWSITGLLAGLYFPLKDTTKTLKILSYLAPQKWFMDVSEWLLVGDKGAFPVLLCITAAYLIVIISIGGVGLKIKRFE